MSNEKMADLKIPEFQKASVRIKNPEKVKQTLEKFIKEGVHSLQVIADFDRTLTRFRYEGKIMPTCHNVLNSGKLTPEGYKEQAEAMYHKYYPIETDKNLTPEEKLPHMVEWWTKAHEIIVASELTKDKLEIMIDEAHIRLRDGVEKTFRYLQEKDVPLLIFSAGVGDVIEGVLRQSSQLYDNMKIVSNFMDFNEAGKISGFKGDIIHIYNKNEDAVHDSDYFKVIANRKNVLLLGDSIGDLSMAKGVEDGTILKVGFLNDRVEDLMELYLNSYDIVLVEDETMDIPFSILSYIT